MKLKSRSGLKTDGITSTVKPVLGGPVLSVHQLKSLNFRLIFTLKQTCIQQTPLLNGHRHQNQAIIKRTLQVFPEGIFMTLGLYNLLRRVRYPGNLVILLKEASCKRFVIKDVKYDGKKLEI